jgi:lactoylglutathione lyase
MQNIRTEFLVLQSLLVLLTAAVVGCEEDDDPDTGETASAAQGSAGRSGATSADGDEAVAAAPREVAYVVLRVSDLARSEAFYRDVLGMQESFRFDIGNEMEEVAFGYPNASGEVTGAGIVLLYDPNRTEPFEHGNTYSRYVLAVPDVEATFRHLEEVGLPDLRPPVRYEQFKAIVGFATDPDGYAIEILERIP